MYLKRLEIHGFKSFAHKTALEFDPGLTAVVGPNGSGKSNVADAIRWVMGEQSLKLLRGKKSEDVIFAGSDKKAKLSMAAVSLTFDNQDRKLPIEYNEVVVTRHLYRNGESEYLINKQKVRLLDIVDLLLRSGFGATNYAVIGQGTIDQMVMAGPAEIKTLVEEASGVKPYYIKRDKTAKRMQITEENLSSVQQLLNEIEPRLRSLKRQAKRMEERETVALELQELRMKYYGHEFYLIENELKALLERLQLTERDLHGQESELRQLQQGLERHEKESRDRQQFADELAKKITRLEQQKLSVQERLAEIRGRIKAEMVPGSLNPESLKLEQMDLTRSLDESQSRLKKLNLDLKKQEAGFEELKSQLTKLNAEIERTKNKEIDRESLSKKLSELEREFSALLQGFEADNLQTIKQKLEELLSRLTAVRKQLEHNAPLNVAEILVTKEELIDRLHSLELRLVEDQTLKRSLLEQIENKSGKLNYLKQLLKDTPKEIKHALLEEEEKLNGELSGLQGQLDELKQTQNNDTDEDKKRRAFQLEEEKKIRISSQQIAKLKDEQSGVLIEKAKIDTRIEGLRKEASDVLGAKITELASFKTGDLDPTLTNKIDKLKKQLELSGGVDEQILMEYRETQQRYDYLDKQHQDLSKAANDLRAVIEELDQIIKQQFDEAFNRISEKFSEYFRILFNGGRAQMNLLKELVVEENDAGEENGQSEETEEEKTSKNKVIVGIEIKATPPGKKLTTITALSGGERALTAIALLCSLLASYPSPFVVLDEVDAALDEANSIRFAKILGTLVHQTQFVTITHNRETMRQAHTLYGVTMDDDGVSRILSLKLEKAEALAE